MLTFTSSYNLETFGIISLMMPAYIHRGCERRQKIREWLLFARVKDSEIPLVML